MPLHFKKIIGIALAASVAAAASASAPAQAQTTGAPSTNPTAAPYTLLEPLPCLGSGSTNCNSSTQTITSFDIQQFIPYAYKFLIALAVVLAVFMITVGGFEYMMSEAITSKSDAVTRIQNAVWGLLLALCTYLILYTIDPNLVSSNNLSIPPVSQSQSPATASANASSSGQSTGGGSGFGGSGAGGTF